MSTNHQKYCLELATHAKKASVFLRGVNTLKKNEVLITLANIIRDKNSNIKLENKKDLNAGKEDGLSSALLDRLELNDNRIEAIAKSLEEIVTLPDPVGIITEGKNLPNGISLQKKRVPIGVVACIFESRPNVTVDIGALGLKSSNSVILRGGKEAIHSNIYLASLFHQALNQHNFPTSCVQLIENTDRGLMNDLLKLDKHIDLVVPRGGSALIQYVSANSTIPVIKHDAGICHLYIHHDAPKNMAIDIAVNGKVQRPSVCNALETIIFHKDFAYRNEVLNALRKSNVIFHADLPTKNELSSPNYKIEDLHDSGYSTEYLELEISLKTVSSFDDAIKHIEQYNSGHSEVIVTNDLAIADEFQQRLDSAAIFINCSSRFHDGGQFGYGAEVGISTGKLHCRGPMSLVDLTTTKYIVTGNGQIRE